MPLETHSPARESVAEKVRTEPPSMYRVLLLNDDYTPMDFVVVILQKFFAKKLDDATEIMLAVHQKGAGLCGIYPHDIAETKSTQLMAYARQNHHPLQSVLEKE